MYPARMKGWMSMYLSMAGYPFSVKFACAHFVHFAHAFASLQLFFAFLPNLLITLKSITSLYKFNLYYIVNNRRIYNFFLIF